MEIVVSLLLGIIIGSAVTYYVLQKINLRKTVREYETQIQVLKEQHQQALKDARNRSLDGSRAVIKGKITEQLGTCVGIISQPDSRSLEESDKP
jgi:predicted Holliday junction resolvase-like endonuclease